MAESAFTVSSPVSFVDVTLTPDTAALASGDVACATQPVAGAAAGNGGVIMLSSLMLIDPDDQGVALDLVFMGNNTTLGTENAVPDIDDVEALDLLGIVSIAAADYVDLGANRIATKSGINLMMRSGPAANSIYVAAIARGAATYAGGSLKLRLGFLQA